MTDKTTISIWIAMNESGEIAVSIDDAGDAIQNLQDNTGAEAIRTVQVMVTMAPPSLDQVEVDVPDTDEQPIAATAA